MMSREIKKILAYKALSGFICWYAVEKFFLRSIDISFFQISVLATLYIGISAFFNVPSGIFADKFGRKKALILAATFLTASTLLAGLSQNFWQYTVAGILWGLFYTFESGAFGAILYDTLKSEKNEANYAKIKGYSSAVFWMFLFISSLVGAWVSDRFGVREVFFITLVPNLLCLSVCFSLKEPKLHESIENESNIFLAKSGFRMLIKTKAITWLAALFIVIELFSWNMNEFDQLYFIDLGFLVFGLAVINAFSGLAQGIGALSAGKFNKMFSPQIMVGIVTILFVITISLPSNVRYLILASFLIMGMLREAFKTVIESMLHHEIPSKIRATVMSAVGMIQDTLLATSFLTFGVVSQSYGTRAGFFSLFLYIGIILLSAKIFISKTNTGSISKFLR